MPGIGLVVKWQVKLINLQPCGDRGRLRRWTAWERRSRRRFNLDAKGLRHLSQNKGSYKRSFVGGAGLGPETKSK